MAHQKSIRPILLVLSVFIASVSQLSFGQTIVYPADSSLQELIAAKEVRRYIYLRTGQKLTLSKDNTIPENVDLILVANIDNKILESLRDSLNYKINPDGFIIKTINQNSRQILVITGYDSTSTLYGAYRYSEHLGVGFSLIRDVIPDKKITLDISDFDEVGEPLLKTRGILPFHDFPEGPDLWNTDDYMVVISQLPKLGMNFIGLHTYPWASTTQDKDKNIFQGPEPTVWVGLEQDINPDGTVKWSYPAYYAHTHRPDRRWGFAAYDTEHFHAGACQLFQTNGFGSDVIGEVMPSDVKSSNQVFNRTGKMFKKVFNHANNLGVKTAVGTELPMGLEPKGPEVDYDWIRVMPPELQRRLSTMGKDPKDPSSIKQVYKGIFERIKRTHPLDYYWLWSWEVWSMHGVSDEQIDAFKNEMKIAYQALQEVNAPFQLALAGWIIGTADNPAEFDNTLPPQVPIYGLWDQAQGFEELSAGRVKWAATWLEEDWGLMQPQLEAHRIYADAKAALEKKCDALIAKHWRTRVLSSNIGSMKDILWIYGQTGQPLEKKLPTNKNKWIEEFYLDWATRQFGPEAAKPIADIFTGFEKKGESGSGSMSHVLSWDSDDEDSGNAAPGAIMSNPEPWTSEKSKYAFITKFENLRSKVIGAGNLERFDYWLNVFMCYRIMAEYGTMRHRFEDAAENENWVEALALRKRMARSFGKLMTHEIKKVSNSSDLGEIINLEILNWYQLMMLRWDTKLKEGLGKEIPADANPSIEYNGPPVMMVDAIRTNLYGDEPLNLKVRIIGKPDSVTIYYRSLGEGKYQSKVLTHIARGVYALTLPPQPGDFEYYLEAQSSSDKVVYPVTAPNLNQTVVVIIK
ncbi:MAG: alpha-glucuronidase family glycosyl hydrolase [Planctomycetota bacterium]